LRDFLIERGFLQLNKIKPIRPKEAMELALRTAKIPRSSSIYESLAKSVSLQRCKDKSFEKFKSTLINWFPADFN
jgi:hypothetical protein